MSEITDIVRNLRKNSTPAEKVLWEKLRDHRFIGLKFKRQEPIIFKYDNSKRFFVADFLCPDLKLSIELDGKIHEYQKEHDEIRDEILLILGYQIIRISNQEVLNNINLVLMKLKEVFEKMREKNG